MKINWYLNNKFYNFNYDWLSFYYFFRAIRNNANSVNCLWMQLLTMEQN